jgi:hypothetical protein
MKTVIEMAREAGARPQQNKNCDVEYLMSAEALERFAELARAADRAEATIKLEKRVREAYQDGHSAGVTSEREACAKVCIELPAQLEEFDALNRAAAAIRARSNT